MAEPIIGEIKLIPYSFIPRLYAGCSGGFIPIAENTALFSLISTTYGGDGRTTMQLPNLVGRTAIHQGTGPGLYPRFLGRTYGEVEVSLSSSSLPEHTHSIYFIQDLGDSTDPTNRFLGVGVVPGGGSIDIYNPSADATNITPMSSRALAVSGQSLPHENMQPYQVLTYVIALTGIYPSRS